MNENVVFTPPVNSAPPLDAPVEQPYTHYAPEQTGKRNYSQLRSILIRVALALLVVLGVFFIVFRVIAPLFFAPEKKVALTYWGVLEDEKTMNVIIADFQKRHPNITVEYVVHRLPQYREKVTTQIKNGNGPDLYRFHNTWVPMLSEYLLPLPEEVIKVADLREQYYPVVQQDVAYRGGIYGVPLSIDTLSLFVNTEIFTAVGVPVPTNWNDFVSAAKALTVPDEQGNIKTAGVAFGTFTNIVHAPDIISMLLLQSGANLHQLEASRQNIADALVFYTDFAKGKEKVWDTRLDPSLLAFTKGNVAMYFGYSSDVFAIKQANGSLPFSVHPVPSLQDKAITTASYWVEGISSKSKNPKEAMLFLQFLLEKEQLQKLHAEAAKTRAFGQLYARKDLADSLKDNPLAYPFVQQAMTAQSTVFTGETYDNGLNAQASAYMGTLVQKSLNGGVDEQALTEFITSTDQLLQQYGLK